MRRRARQESGIGSRESQGQRHAYGEAATSARPIPNSRFTIAMTTGTFTIARFYIASSST
ncbi:hypothetical protein XAC3810_240273 [Xanthomonas citri pv. citri]|uniref:Uncharacterized protein n=1 Tax=Xanthomonas citri pv. citri TaxID=611301 RepID=A0A0U5FBJ9_XANCI|nr:hypothetical protein XAC9322_230116 [Xanthomonas citri pv. citri]CEE20844.1 hypothetical protein XAC3824_240116 [Xanthomonas citri pv. citri]CEE22261.1 hypothetical protein XAC1083_220273 [Xanthomonas citri pv. citri]CEE30612.1 hypothetical protein XAC3810_240273 [Xanthomonas citri pv. citri]CEE33186.1 hypothetical protein XAC902_300104 [Xanthomonas citri pv. citri]